MPKLIFIGLVAFFFACEQRPKQPQVLPTISAKQDTLKQDTIAKKEKILPDTFPLVQIDKNIKQQGKEEYLAWKNRKPTSQKRRDSIPSMPYSKVILYELIPHTSAPETSDIFKRRTGKYAQLTKAEIEEFASLINNKKSYGNTTAACFDPRHGVVFYDENNVPTDFVTICLECNYLQAAPHLKAVAVWEKEEEYFHYGFSKATRKYFLKLFRKHKMPCEDNGSLFD